MDIDEVKKLVRQNDMLKTRIADLTTQQSEIKTMLNEAVDELGTKDDKGHIILEVDDDVTGIGRITRQRRVSKTLDIDVAEDLLRERGIHERCITMVPMLNEDEIMAAYYDGAITEEDIDKMFPSKVTWALVIK